MRAAHPRLPTLVAGLVAGLLIGSGARPAPGADPVIASFAEAAPAAPDVPQITAVGLRSTTADVNGPMQLVVLIDTSASQTGLHRQRSLDALAGLIEKARPEDRIAVAAVDVASTPLTEGFHAAGDDALKMAARALDARTPLGSTDIVAALEDAAARFEGDGPRAIVYIGDGPALNGVDADEFAGVVDLLRSGRISVSSLGIGPAVNWQCLAALAANTGGVAVIPGPEDDANKAAVRVGTLAIQQVEWPAAVRLAGDAADGPPRMLPARVPPLRADRDSIVLIGGPLEAARLEITFGDSGAESPVFVAVPAAEPTADNAFLSELVRSGRGSDGLFLPVVGREGLAAVRDVVRAEAASLAALSARAKATGADDSATRLAEAALRRDPDNQEATIIREASRRQAGTAAPLPQPPGPLPPAADDELAELDRARRVRAKALEQDAAVRIREARQLLTRDPDLARDQLKAVQDAIKTSARPARNADPGVDRPLPREDGAGSGGRAPGRDRPGADAAHDRAAAAGGQDQAAHREVQRPGGRGHPGRLRPSRELS
jgi:hypothetical protein